MNNATLALNVTRPAPQAKSATPPLSGQDQDDTASPKRFDAALDTAHANARGTHEPSRDSTAKHDPAPAPAPKTADAQNADQKPEEDPEKKDAKDDDDTSIAATMLSLIGVPPKVTDVATKMLGTVTGGADSAAAALAPATLAGVLPGTAAGVHAAADDIAGLKEATTAVPAATSTAATPATVAPSFATLLAAQGAGATSAKDDASSVDPANPSPMPLVHSQGIGTANGSVVVQVQASQPATSPQFTQELGEQIAWMGSGQIKEARIKLHPEELGSMDVRVNLDGSKVNIAIMAQHPAAVHAVQQTLSQLDSMLAHHGLSLGQADVGQRQAEQGGAGSGKDAAGQGGDTDATAATDTVATSRVSRGLVDEVA
jgi:flagellar hook-length control protein FliK